MLLRLLLFFSLLGHTQPANAMRQLFQTTISLCVAEAVVRTRSLFFPSFFFFLLSFTLVTPPPSPPSRPCLLVDAGAIFLVRPNLDTCVNACMRACIRTYIRGKGVAHDNGIFAFPPSSFLFLLPCLPPSAFLLGYPSLLLGRDKERVVVVGG